MKFLKQLLIQRIIHKLFTVHTEKPSPQFIHGISGFKTAIVDVTSKDKIVGTGPYEGERI